MLLSCELESSESLQALLAVAMLTQSQQLYGLTRHQAASARAMLASAPAVDIEAVLKVPVTSSIRRKAAYDTGAENWAFQQAQDQQHARSSSASSGSIEHKAEPYWTEWIGTRVPCCCVDAFSAISTCDKHAHTYYVGNHALMPHMSMLRLQPARNMVEVLQGALYRVQLHGQQAIHKHCVLSSVCSYLIADCLWWFFFFFQACVSQ